jgi:hypothetical protein
MPAPKKSIAGYIAKKVAKKVVAKKSTLVKLEPKPNLKASPKSNVKVIPTGPLSPKQTEAKRIAQAKLRMMEINKKNPSWDK